MNDYIEIGKIVSTHGVRGALKVQPWCDSPEDFKKYKTFYLSDAGDNPIKAERISVQGNMIIAWFSEITSIESAALLRNKILYVSRQDIVLPKGKYLIKDIIGCEVSDAETLEIYGKVTDVFNTGANDIWEIKKGDKEYLLPIAPDVLNTVDIENKKVAITPMKGIFDEN